MGARTRDPRVDDLREALDALPRNQSAALVLREAACSEPQLLPVRVLVPVPASKPELPEGVAPRPMPFPVELPNELEGALSPQLDGVLAGR